VIVAVWIVTGACAWAVNTALVAPAATLALAGMTRIVLLDESATVTLLVATLFKVTVHVLLLLALNEVGLQPSDDRTAG